MRNRVTVQNGRVCGDTHSMLNVLGASRARLHALSAPAQRSAATEGSWAVPVPLRSPPAGSRSALGLVADTRNGSRGDCALMIGPLSSTWIAFVCEGGWVLLTTPTAGTHPPSYMHPRVAQGAPTHPAGLGKVAEKVVFGALTPCCRSPRASPGRQYKILLQLEADEASATGRHR